MKEKISEFLYNNAWVDGGHHKQWCIDQILRIITGCEYDERFGIYKEESEEYKKWVADYNSYSNGEYDPWDTGIAP